MRLWARSGGSSGTSSSSFAEVRDLLRRRNKKKARAERAAILPTLTPTPTPTLTEVLGWLGPGAVVGDSVGVHDGEDVDVELDVEVEDVLFVLAGTACAEETAGPIPKKVLGSWQH